MNAETRIEVSPLVKLREPFAANQISKLPKETRAQIDARKLPNSRGIMVFNCPECGGHHHKDAVHLDYVGHAALTDRLLDTDIEWSWEPVAFDQNGLPAFDQNGGLWIKLTVGGVTRLGYGAADGKRGGDAIKEIIGDALRNAAMRFGAALDLWHKGELHVEEAAEGQSQEGAVSPSQPKREPKHSALQTKARKFVHDLEGTGDKSELDGLLYDKTSQELFAEIKEKLPQWWDGGADMPAEFIPLRRRIEMKEYEFASQVADVARA